MQSCRSLRWLRHSYDVVPCLADHLVFVDDVGAGASNDDVDAEALVLVVLVDDVGVEAFLPEAPGTDEADVDVDDAEASSPEMDSCSEMIILLDALASTIFPDFSYADAARSYPERQDDTDPMLSEHCQRLSVRLLRI